MAIEPGNLVSRRLQVIEDMASGRPTSGITEREILDRLGFGDAPEAAQRRTTRDNLDNLDVSPVDAAIDELLAEQPRRNGTAVSETVNPANAAIDALLAEQETEFPTEFPAAGLTPTDTGPPPAPARGFTPFTEPTDMSGRPLPPPGRPEAKGPRVARQDPFLKPGILPGGFDFEPVRPPVDMDQDALRGMAEFYRLASEQQTAQTPGERFTEAGTERPSLLKFAFEGYKRPGGQIAETVSPTIEPVINQIIDKEVAFRLQNGLYHGGHVTVPQNNPKDAQGFVQADVGTLRDEIRQQIDQGLPMVAEDAREAQEAFYRFLAKTQPPEPRGILERAADFAGGIVPFLGTIMTTRGAAGLLGAGARGKAAAELAAAGAFSGAASPPGERLKGAATGVAMIGLFRGLGATGRGIGAEAGRRVGREALGRTVGAVTAEAAGFGGLSAASGAPAEQVLVETILGPLLFNIPRLASGANFKRAVTALRASKASADKSVARIVEQVAAGKDATVELAEFVKALATGRASLSREGRLLWREVTKPSEGADRLAREAGERTLPEREVPRETERRPEPAQERVQERPLPDEGGVQREPGVAPGARPPGEVPREAAEAVRPAEPVRPEGVRPAEAAEGRTPEEVARTTPRRGLKVAQQELVDIGKQIGIEPTIGQHEGFTFNDTREGRSLRGEVLDLVQTTAERRRIRLRKGVQTGVDAQDLGLTPDEMAQAVRRAVRSAPEAIAEEVAEAIESDPTRFSPDMVLAARNYRTIVEGNEVVRTKSEDLNIGDTLTIGGEKHTVTERTKEGGVVLEDGILLEVRPDQFVAADAGSVKPGDAGLFGQKLFTGETGKQKPLLFEGEDVAVQPEKAKPPTEDVTTERIRAKFEKTETEALAFSPSQVFEQPQIMAGEAVAQVSAAKLVEMMSEAAGVPIRVGHGRFKQRKALGFFDPQRFGIRQKVANQLSTSAHEFGHAVNDKVVGWRTKFPTDVAKQLAGWGRELYGDRKPKGGYRREGFAEYTARLFLGDQAVLDTATHKWFEGVLESHPKFAKQWKGLRESFATYDQQGAPARVASMINRIQTGPVGKAKRAFEWVSALFTRQMWTTDAAPLEDAVKKVMSERDLKNLRPDENPATLRAALKMGATSQARFVIREGAINTHFEIVGPPLKEILQPIRKRLEDFTVYAVSKRAQLLRARGINPGISARDAKFTVDTLASPEFDAALKGVTQWYGHLMDYLVDSGGMSPEGAKAIRALNPIYVPFKRFFDSTHLGGAKGRGKAGVVNQASGIKRIKGSGRQIVDIMESFVTQAEEILALGNKLQVARATADFAEKAGKSAWFAEKIPTPKNATRFELGEVIDQLVKIGAIDKEMVSVSSDGERAIISESGKVIGMDELLTVFQNATSYFGKDNIAVIWRKGKREFWQYDPDVFKVITDMDKEYLPPIFQTLMGPFKRAVQLGATGLNIDFSIRNPMRDSQGWNVYMRGKRGVFTTPLSALDGFWHQLRKSPETQQWRAAGGEMATLMGQDRSAARSSVEDALAKGVLEHSAQIISHPVQALRALIGAGESATRIKEFADVLKVAEKKYGVGSRAAVVEALLASKEVTTNFTRQGVLGGLLNGMIPFFNARIQGASKFYRTFTAKDGGRFALQATARAVQFITIPNLILWWLNKDKKWYREKESWDKYGFMHIDTTGAEDGSGVYSIPGAFELQYVFGGIPVSLMEDFYGDHPGEVEDAMWETIQSFLPINTILDILPAMAKPGIEVLTNKKSFPEIRDIDPYWDVKNKLPKDRFNKWTTETAKLVGELLDFSPRRIEHFMSGHTGGMALDVVRFGESLLGLRKFETPLAGALKRRPGFGRSKSVNDLYDRRDALRKQHPESGTDDKTELKKLERAIKDIGKIRKRIDSGDLTEEQGNEDIVDRARRALGRRQISLAAERERFAPLPQDVSFEGLTRTA